MSCAAHGPVSSSESAVPAEGPRSSRRSRWGLLAGLLLGFSTLPLAAQTPVPPPTEMDYTLPFNDASGSAAFPGPEEATVGGMGFKGRIGHEAGETVGRRQSISYFDLSPYIFQDNDVFFGEGRLALGNNGQVGGTAGGGFRRFFPGINSIGGFSAWWDGDDTRGAAFQQWGVSGEILTEWLDVRTNFYFPYGDTFQITGERFEPGTQQFVNSPDGVGTNILFQRRIFTATAMRGFDLMFTAPVPSEVAQHINLETSAGFYHFSADEGTVDKVWGWKLRFDADIWERFSHMFLEVMHDKVFKTNVVFGVDINYWNKLEHRPRIGHSQYHRLAEWTRRNRTVVTFEGSFLGTPEVAINPTTSLPYLVYQVDSNDGFPTGPGTLERPFDDLQTAIDFLNPDGRNADIIFAQGNSVFTSPIVINVDNMQVIGEEENPSITIPVVGLTDEILLPTVTPVPFDKPVIRDVAGPAVTLAANNTRFAAIDITNVTGGPAILADGVDGAEINQVTITTVNDPDGNGIELNNNTGLILLEDIIIRDTEGTAFLVDGGTANILFVGSNLIDNTTNSHASHGFSVQILDAGGSVNLSNTLIEDIGGTGIQVVGSVPGASTAGVTFSDVNLLNTVVPAGTGAVYIFNHSGAVNFTGDITIDNALGDSLVIRDLQPTGSVTSLNAANVNVLNRNGIGLLVDNIQEDSAGTQAGSVVFNGATNISGVTSGTDPAILFRSDVGVLNFVGLVSINGSGGDGVEITPVAGTGIGAARFLADSALTINNVFGTSFFVHDITSEGHRVVTNGMTIGFRGAPGSVTPNGDGISVSNYAGTANFLGTNLINNELNSFGRAVNVINNSGVIAFQNVTVDNARGIVTTGTYNPFFGVRVFNNTNDVSGVSFGSLNVESLNATAVSFDSNAFVTVGTGIIDATNGRGIEIINTQRIGSSLQPGTLPPIHEITFESISASNSDYGILIERAIDPATQEPIRNEGRFLVTGLNGALGSGGSISNMTAANIINTIPPGVYPFGRSGQFVGAAGALFQDTQVVELNFMDFNNNLIGVAADRIITEDLAGNDPSVLLNGMDIRNSQSEGIFMRDVSDFTLQNSSVSSNGVLNAQQQIEILATIAEIDIDLDNAPDLDTVEYRFVFDNNDISDQLTGVIPATDMIFIHTGTGISDPVLLNLFFINNGQPPAGLTTVTSNRVGGQAALDVQWEGTFNATITNNEFVLLNGGGQVGVALNIDGVADVVFSNNAMSGNGNGNTGLQFVFQEQAAVEISNNGEIDANGNFVNNSGFLFGGVNSTAIELTFLSNNNRIFIEDNLIQFTNVARASTGIRFNRIFGNNGDTTVTINGNQIDLFPFNSVNNFTIERGIFFQDVRGLITLNGNVDNIITPPTLLPFYVNFSIPPGTSQGQIIVNGTPVP